MTTEYCFTGQEQVIPVIVHLYCINCATGPSQILLCPFFLIPKIQFYYMWDVNKGELRLRFCVGVVIVISFIINVWPNLVYFVLGVSPLILLFPIVKHLFLMLPCISWIKTTS